MCFIKWLRHINQIKIKKMTKKTEVEKKSDFEIKKMRNIYRMTVIELINMIRWRGLIIPTEITEDKYIKREIILFDGNFFLAIDVFHKFLGTHFCSVLYVFDTHQKAQNFYKRLKIKHYKD